MEGCTLVEVFIVLEQEMQEFGRLGMLSNYFLWDWACSEGTVGHMTLCTWYLAPYGGKC